MFEERIKWARKKIKEKELDKNIWFLENDEWYDRGYWKGYIEGLKSAEGILKRDRKQVMLTKEENNNV